MKRDTAQAERPLDGTIYRVRPMSLTIAPSDGPASSEPMLQYASSVAAAPATTPPAAPNIAPPAAALPPIPATPALPTAKDPNDDEFVAMALSPQSHNGAGGFGMYGTQEQANQIALNQGRHSSGNDDCLLINAGMFHGCVAYGIDRADRH